MKLGKRFLALLLALTMVLSNLPVSVLAEEFQELTAETVVEETQEILEETTQAPTEMPTEAPAETQAPTEAPVETEEPTEAAEETLPPETTAAEETEPVAEETEPQETLPVLLDSSEEAMNEDTAPYLSFGILQETEDGYVEPDTDHRDGWQYRIMPSEHYMMQFFLNTWDGDQYVQEPAPMVSTSYITYTPIEGGEYFYDVSVSYWDTQLELVTVLDDGSQVGGITIHTNRNEVGWYSSPSMSNSTWLWEYEYDPDEELSLYVGTDNTYDDSYLPDGAPVIENVPEGYITLEAVNPQETYDKVYKVMLSDEAIAELNTGKTLYPEVIWNGWWSNGEYMEKNTQLTLRMNPDKVAHQPYLSFRWLENWGEGWFESEEREIEFGMGAIWPGRDYNPVFYLNTWDAENELWTAEPVSVDKLGYDTNVMTIEKLTDLGEPIAGDQANADYFTRLTPKVWDAVSEIYCYDDAGNKVSMYFDSTLGHMSFHSTPACTTEDVIIHEIWLDTDAEETVFYFRFETSDATLTETPSPVGVWADYVDVTYVREGIYKITVSSECMDRAEGMESVQLECKVVDNDGNPGIWGSGIGCWWESHESYMSFGWLENWGEGWFETEWHEQRDYNIRPGDEFYHIYYINTYDPESGEWTAEPLNGADPYYLWYDNDYLTLEKIDPEEIRGDQENGDCFYKVTAVAWNQDAGLTLTGTTPNAAGEYDEICSMYVGTHLGETSFHSAKSCTTSNFINSLAVDPFGDNVVYYRFESDYWKADSIQVSEEDAAVTKVSEGIWKLTLTDEFVMKAMDGTSLEVSPAAVAKDDPSITETNWTDGLWCYMDAGECLAMLGINGDTYEIFGDKQILHHYPTGNMNENMEREWAAEIVTALPTGVTYNYKTNVLTLKNAELTHLSLGYNGYEGVQNLPNGDLTIALSGTNTILNDSDMAVYMYGDLNVTFTGKGSLTVKSTNSVDNTDRWGNPYHYPTWFMEGGSLTLSESVKVTVEIAGEGLYERWEDDTYLGTYNAPLIALNMDNTDVTLTGKATLTTVIPEGASYNGPKTEGGRVDGNSHYEGGYSGLSGFRNLRVEGGTLTTDNISLNEGSSYYQTAGTVIINGTGAIFTDMYYDEETDTEYEQDHYHYFGIRGDGPADISITGGTLTINLEPTEEEHAVSSYFCGIETNGGRLIVGGGTVNINGKYNGTAFQINNETTVTVSGGTINASGAVTDESDRNHVSENDIVFMDLTPGSKAYFTGGTINADWASFYMGGEVVYNGTKLNGYGNLLFADNLFEMKSGTITLDSGAVFVNGQVEMTGGKWDLPRTFIEIHNGFIFSGGEITIDYDGTNYHDYENAGGRPVAVAFYSYFEVGEGAKLTVVNEADAPAIEIGAYYWMDGEGNAEYDEEGNACFTAGHLFVTGGTVSVTHSGLDGYPGVVFWTEDTFAEDIGWPVCVADGGVLNLSGPKNTFVYELLLANGPRQMYVGENGEVNITNGSVGLYGGSNLTIDGGSFNLDAQVLERAEDEWYTSFQTDWYSSVDVCGGSLTIDAEDFDCAMDVCGTYTQTGGTVTVKSHGEQGERSGVSVKKGFILEDGTLDIQAEAYGLSIGHTWENGDPDAVNYISGGELNLNAKDTGMSVEAVMDITGGDINIDVSGLLFDYGDGSGNQILVGNGILVFLGTEAEPGFASRLTMTGGDLTITFPAPPKNQEYEYDSIITSMEGFVELLGGTYRSIGGCPLISMTQDPAYLFVIGEDMDLYSLEGGEKLVPVDYIRYWDAEGNQTDAPAEGGFCRYLRYFTEGNVQGLPGLDDGVQWADQAVAVTNVCGPDTTWELNGTTLKIQGTGTINNYSAKNAAPWTELSDFISRVEVGEHVTHIGAFAFNGLEAVKYITFLGDAPSFHTNALVGVTAKGYYPSENSTWTSDVLQNYGGKITWKVDADTILVTGVESSADYLVSGGKVTLTAKLSAELDESMQLQWTLADDSKSIASLSVKNGTATVTAKTVKEKQTVTLYVGLQDSNKEPYEVQLPLYAKATAVIIEADGEDVTGKKYSFDYTSTDTIVLDAALVPNDIAEVMDETVEWISAKESLATVEDGVVTIKGYGEVKITAKALDGSKKSAFVTLVPYFRYEGKLSGALKETTELLEKSVSEGLQVGDQVQILVTAEDGTLIPAEELTYAVTSGGKYASVDEDGIITAEAEKGTVKVKASLKDDPQARSVTVTVKTTATKPDALDLQPNADQMGEVYDDFFYEDGFVYEEYDETWHLYVTSGSKKTFTMTAVGEHGIIGEMSVKGAVTWTTSNRAIAAVKEASDGTVTVTIAKGMEGTCYITGTSKLNEEATVTLEITVTDFAPALKGSSITLNTYKDNDSETMALTSHVDDQIQEVEVLIYNKTTKTYDSTDVFTAQYGNDEVTITAQEAADKGTIKAQLLVTTEHAEYELPFSIKVANKIPSVTVKQIRKVNLSDVNSYGLLTVTAKDAIVEDIELVGGNFVVEGKDADGNFIISHDGSAEFVAKTTVQVTLKDYVQQPTKSLKVSTEKIANKAVLGASTLNMFLNLPNMTASTTLSTYFVGVGVDDFELTAGKLKVECVDGVLTVSAPEGMPAKGTYRINLAPEVNGVALKTVKLTVKVAAAPKVKLKSSTAKMKLSEQGAVLEVAVTAPEAGNYPLSFQEITDGTYDCSDEIDLKYNAETGNLVVSLKEACTTTGKRAITLTPMYGDVAADQVKLTVSVS